MLPLLLACTTGKADPPATAHPTDVAIWAGGGGACLLTDQKATCQMVQGGDIDYGQMDPPGVDFTALTVGDSITCGLHPDQTATCWGWSTSEQLDVPDVRWRQIEMDYEHACGITTDGSIQCWGRAYVGENDAPDGNDWIDVGAEGVAACALDGAGVPICWGFEDNGLLAETPAGPFVDIVTEGPAACGVTAEGRVTCWGAESERGYTPVPDEAGLAQLTLGDYHACALREDHTVICWGINSVGTTPPPTGTFRSIAAGQHFVCGVHEDAEATVECWGCSKEGDEYCHCTPAPFFE